MGTAQKSEIYVAARFAIAEVNRYRLFSAGHTRIVNAQSPFGYGVGKHALADDVATGVLTANFKMTLTVRLDGEVLMTRGNAKNGDLDVRRWFSVRCRHRPRKPTICVDWKIDIRALGPRGFCYK